MKRLLILLLPVLLGGCDSNHTQHEQKPPSAIEPDRDGSGVADTPMPGDSASAATVAPDADVAMDSSAVEFAPAPGEVDVILPPAPTELTPQERRVKVKIHSLTGYGNNEAFARAAAQRLEDVLNSKAFKAAILANTFAYDRGQELTPAELYDRIMKAHEEDGPGGEDGVVDLRLRTLELNGQDSRMRIWCNRNSVGADGSGSGVAAVCPGWLQECATNKNTAALASHYAHEYMHILGFSHIRRKYTKVPYKVDTLVEQLANAAPPKANNM